MSRAELLDEIDYWRSKSEHQVVQIERLQKAILSIQKASPCWCRDIYEYSGICINCLTVEILKELGPEDK